jgi:hypothetical protein
MNTQFKVGQKVRVITGANVVDSDMFNNMAGVIVDILLNNTPDVCIYVDFQNGYKIWCYTQNDRGITLNVEILGSDTFSATIEFRGDMSVGIRPYYYTLGLDANLIEVFADDKAYRDELRNKIQALYTEIDNEMKCHEIFSYETI